MSNINFSSNGNTSQKRSRKGRKKKGASQYAVEYTDPDAVAPPPAPKKSRIKSKKRKKRKKGKGATDHLQTVGVGSGLQSDDTSTVDNAEQATTEATTPKTQKRFWFGKNADLAQIKKADKPKAVPVVTPPPVSNNIAPPIQSASAAQVAPNLSEVTAAETTHDSPVVKRVGPADIPTTPLVTPDRTIPVPPAPPIKSVMAAKPTESATAAAPVVEAATQSTPEIPATAAPMLTEQDRKDTSLPHLSQQEVTQQPMPTKEPIAKQAPEPRIIPTPPAPPVHVAAPIEEVVTSPVQEQHTQPIVEQPTQVVAPQTTHATSVSSEPIVPNQPAAEPAPNPVSRPVIPAAPQPTVNPASAAPQPAGLSSASKQRKEIEQPGKVYAKRVADVHGKQTQPTALEPALFEVNLLPSIAGQGSGPFAVVGRLLMVALVSISLVGVAYGALVTAEYIYLTRAQTTQGELAELDTTIQSFNQLRTDIKRTNSQVEEVQTLLDNHVYWTNFFALIEEYTLPNVTYSSFSGTTSGLVTLQASTTDFTSVTRQVGVLQDQPELFSNIVVSSASQSGADSDATEEVEETDLPEEPAEDVLEVVDDEAPEDEVENEDSATNQEVAFSISFQVNSDIFYYGGFK